MAKPLHIVRPQLTEDEIRAALVADGITKVSVVRDKFGLSRAVARRLVAEVGETPKAAVKPPAQPKPKPVTVAPTIVNPPEPVPVKPKPSRASHRLIGASCGLGGLALGAGGMVMNWCFAYSFGHDVFSSTVLGLIGVAIDWIALWLLPAAGALGEQRRIRWLPAPMSVLACVAWLPFVTLSTVAAMGFAGSNIGDSVQAKGDVIQHKERLGAELAAARIKRWQIVENGNPLVLEQQIQIAQGKVPAKNWKDSDHCTNVSASGPFCEELNGLRKAKAMAEGRDQLDKDIHDLTEKISKMPSIAAADPAADQISQMTFGYVTAEQVENYRVRGLAIVPGFASILLTFTRALLR